MEYAILILHITLITDITDITPTRPSPAMFQTGPQWTRHDWRDRLLCHSNLSRNLRQPRPERTKYSPCSTSRASHWPPLGEKLQCQWVLAIFLKRLLRSRIDFWNARDGSPAGPAVMTTFSSIQARSSPLISLKMNVVVLKINLETLHQLPSFWQSWLMGILSRLQECFLAPVLDQDAKWPKLQWHFQFSSGEVIIQKRLNWS